MDGEKIVAGLDNGEIRILGVEEVIFSGEGDESPLWRSFDEHNRQMITSVDICKETVISSAGSSVMISRLG